MVIDFYLSKHRDSKSAKKFFERALKTSNSTSPRVITIDKNPAYIKVIPALKEEKKIPLNTSLRQIKYLNNIIEQDHRFIKKKIKYTLGFKSFKSAKKTICGIEAMHMIRKEQVKNQVKSVLFEVQFINKLFGITC